MRFPTLFRRRVGVPPDPVPQVWLQQEARHISDAGDWMRCLVPELGSDSLPKLDEQPSRRDCLHTSTMVNKNGFPSQRVAVGYHGPEGAPPLLADLYLLDETSRLWFRVPSPSNGILSPGTLSYFDPPCLLDHSRAKKHAEDETHMSGDLEVLLLVSAVTPDGKVAVDRDGFRTLHPKEVGVGDAILPTGVYTFVVGTDVSNPG